jgi:hypothetical protein
MAGCNGPPERSNRHLVSYYDFKIDQSPTFLHLDRRREAPGACLPVVPLPGPDGCSQWSEKASVGVPVVYRLRPATMIAVVEQKKRPFRSLASRSASHSSISPSVPTRAFRASSIIGGSHNSPSKP